MSNKFSSVASGGPSGSSSSARGEGDEDESVAEEIESDISEALDEQDPYGDYDEDFIAASNEGLGNVAPTATKAVGGIASTAKGVQGSSRAPIRDDPAKLPSKAARNRSFSSRGGDDDDGYSFSFEDNDAGEGSPNASRQRRTSGTKPPHSQQMVPSMDMQTLQAEMSLQKLSEEVIQLRNKQRSLLKERWVQVRDKKSRAEARRQQHIQEIEELRNRIAKVTNECNDLKTTNSSLNAALVAAEASVKTHVESYEVVMRSLEAKNVDYEALQVTLSNTRSELDALRSEMARQTRQHEIAITNANMEIAKRDVQIEVLSKSNETNEKRFEKQRDALPEYHNSVLQTKLQQLDQLEADMRARDEMQRQEAEKRQAAIEVHRKEVLEDVERFRQRIQAELNDERRQLDQIRLEYAAKESKLHIASAEASAAADRTLAEARRQQAEAAEALQVLRREEAAFTARQSMIEPLLSDAEQDRETARAMRRDAQMLVEHIENRESLVLGAETSLRVRERNAEQMVTESRQLTQTYLSKKADLEATAVKIASQKATVLKERFRLHRCSMEIAAQMELLKRGISDAVSYGVLQKGVPASSNYRADQFTNDENVENIDRMSPSSYQSKMRSMHLVPLVRELEDASERMRIINKELTEDPFAVSVGIEPALLLRGSTEAFDTPPPAPLPQHELYEESGMPSRIAPSYKTDDKLVPNRLYQHNVFDFTGPFEVKSYVEDASASIAALKKAAMSFGVNTDDV